MSPETKEALDYLVTFLGPASLGGVLLALVGVWKAKAEKPHVEKPSVGAAGMAQIGGMVLGQQTAQDIIDGLRINAAAHDRCTLSREAQTAEERKIWNERQAHERKLAEDRHDDVRDIVDQLRTLNDRLRDARLA